MGDGHFGVGEFHLFLPRVLITKKKEFFPQQCKQRSLGRLVF